MHAHEKISLMGVDSLAVLPKLKFDRIECPRCHRQIPVPNEYVDWREVAERYEKAFARQHRLFSAMLKEAGEQFDAPLVEYFEASRQEMLESLRSMLAELESKKNVSHNTEL